MATREEIRAMIKTEMETVRQLLRQEMLAELKKIPAPEKNDQQLVAVTQNQLSLAMANVDKRIVTACIEMGNRTHEKTMKVINTEIIPAVNTVLEDVAYRTEDGTDLNSRYRRELMRPDGTQITEHLRTYF